MTTFEDRATAALLGLALGDAYGRTLEFERGAAVRAAPAGPGFDFMWTDDTHMSLYLAEAVLDVAGPLDDDAFGARVGLRFSAWLDDPLTPSTAPGGTCIEGVRAWRQTRSWRTSGVRRSDGCGAVMRVCPLPVVFTGDELIRAARVQAALTHAHPNAPETAAAACWILRALLDGHPLDGTLVREAADRSRRGAWTAFGTSVPAALDAAVVVGGRHEAEWLDEAAIPDGDGGWRSPSALGLALAAALCWGHDDEGRVTPATFARAVDKAARIDGDSDSVACLAGVFLGAEGGRAALPAAWLAALPQRAHLEDVARRLVAAGGAR